MQNPGAITHKLSSNEDERLIRVLIADEEGGFNATSFPETEIARVMELGAARSALILRSGTEIPVALSYEQLEQKIYYPDFRDDSTVLDMRDVTGAAAQLKGAEIKEAPASEEAGGGLTPGDKMPDGTVFAGLSPDTNKPLFTTPQDAPLEMTFNNAQKYGARLNAHGHRDWRVPSTPELNVMFNNRAAIGGFAGSGGPAPQGWYWASESDDFCGRAQAFHDDQLPPGIKDGEQGGGLFENHNFVRCVRSGPG